MIVHALIFAHLIVPAALQVQVRQLPAQSTTLHVQPLPDEALRMNARLERNLAPSARAKVRAGGSELLDGAKHSPTLTSAQMQGTARVAVQRAFPDAKGMDIDALVYAVLMDAANQAESDLQQVMSQMQGINEKKSSLRSQIAASQKLSASQSGSQRAETEASQKKLQGDLDSMNEMSEMTSMRLQMAMDRRSKFVEAMSNVMKKIDSTQESIVQNMK